MQEVVIPLALGFYQQLIHLTPFRYNVISITLVVYTNRRTLQSMIKFVKGSVPLTDAGGTIWPQAAIGTILADLSNNAHYVNFSWADVQPIQALLRLLLVNPSRRRRVAPSAFAHVCCMLYKSMRAAEEAEGPRQRADVYDPHLDALIAVNFMEHVIEPGMLDLTHGARVETWLCPARLIVHWGGKPMSHWSNSKNCCATRRT
jgi:hypothetical protein